MTDNSTQALQADFSRAMRALRRRWLAACACAGAYLFLMDRLLAIGWSGENRMRWLLAAGAVCVYILGVLWRALPENIRKGESVLLSSFGSGNTLTLARGILVSALAGFAFTPPPKGGLSWLPGLIYIFAGIADLFDGYLARKAQRVTHMGELLDMSLDGMGVLWASILLYHYGKIPAWILLVGAARYIYLGIEWLRKRWGKAVFVLPRSISRRALAGAQMGFLGAALLPVFTPAITTWAGVVFVVPFLIGFTRDTLIMSGILSDHQPASKSKAAFIFQQSIRWLPLLFRMILFFAVCWQFLAWRQSLPGFLVPRTPLGEAHQHFLWMTAFYLLGVTLTTSGILGRFGGMLNLIAVGLQQMILPGGVLPALILICASGIFFLGSGALSIWQPEDRLIERRLGEK
ncbi:MAG: CDP-alcohol phosphatidyltransferase family protein [Chloroflexota bacterium]